MVRWFYTTVLVSDLCVRCTLGVLDTVGAAWLIPEVRVTALNNYPGIANYEMRVTVFSIHAGFRHGWGRGIYRATPFSIRSWAHSQYQTSASCNIFETEPRLGPQPSVQYG